VIGYQIQPSECRKEKGKANLLSPEFGAGEESRTLDLNLGKVALYQLSYSRKTGPNSIHTFSAVQQLFAKFAYFGPGFAKVIDHRPDRQERGDPHEPAAQEAGVNGAEVGVKEQHGDGHHLCGGFQLANH
jgi:hypothetical protein